MKTILMLGCFDTKDEDFAYLYNQLKTQDVKVLTMNTGVRGTSTSFVVDIEAQEIAAAAGTDFSLLSQSEDRSFVIEKIGAGAAKLISKLYKEGRIDGAIGMGGGGGTYIALAAMQALPIGVPKLCLSTVASKDLSRQVGTKDIVLMPSVVDVAGLNRISKKLIAQAAGAINGMVHTIVADDENAKKTVAISMFGNTTECVEHCTALLKEKGFEVLAFHAVGSGGMTMEALIRDGYVDGVLDITTTELADELCEGICSAGPERLTAAAEMSIPQVVVPGCLDMVNYAHIDTVPSRFKDRNLYSWAPDVTLMRTNEEENQILGASIANKLNKSEGPVAVLIPLLGISKVSSDGGPFHNPDIDQLLFEQIKINLKPSISYQELNENINSEVFANHTVNLLLQLM